MQEEEGEADGEGDLSDENVKVQLSEEDIVS